MNSSQQQRALNSAITAARAAGKLIRANLGSKKTVASATRHDIKLELDVRCQKLIEQSLRRAFPRVAVLGEEGTSGEAKAPQRWVVDPIDGTVNFAYGIPHASVSIALQEQIGNPRAAGYPDGFQTLVGVVYDPFCDELWTAIRGQPARLNGRVIRASTRRRLGEAIISIGFAKTAQNLERTLPYFIKLAHRVRKLRIMGSAALALTYVASGRFDGYIERGIRLWDIAAGGLLVECAGGKFWRQSIPGAHAYRMVASNPWLVNKLKVPD